MRQDASNLEGECLAPMKPNDYGKFARARRLIVEAAARPSSAERLIATKALRRTATAWILIVAQCSAIL